jgi:hypothetical protein
VCLCIARIIINDDQQDATIFDLFISILLYMFRAALSPIIRSTYLHLQFQVFSTDFAAGWYTSCKYGYVLPMMGGKAARNM